MGIDCEVKKDAVTHWLALIKFQYIDVAGGESQYEVPLGQQFTSYCLCLSNGHKSFI